MLTESYSPREEKYRSAQGSPSILDIMKHVKVKQGERYLDLKID
jgi:hypothetical protein